MNSQPSLFDIVSGALGYPLFPGHKTSGTSALAADAVADASATLRAAALRVLREAGPSTADEVAARLGHSILGIRPRLSELQRLGQVVKTKLRRRNESGMSATVWEAA